MSALAEALVAAQRRALAQLEKGYVRGPQEDRDEAAQGFRDALAAIGLADREDVETLIACLEVIRQTGGTLPAEANGSTEKPAEKATGAQVTFVQDLLKRGDHAPLSEADLRNLSREKVSALIEALKQGTYDPTEWDVPF